MARPNPVHLVFVALVTLATAAWAESPFDGHWKGAIALPSGQLDLDVDIGSNAAGELSGDISIPVQAIRDRALGDFAIDGRTVTFSIPGIPGDPTFEGTLDTNGTTLSGPFRQGGGELTFSLTLGDDAAAAARAALEGFDAVIEKAVADFNVPGLGIAIVAGGEVVLARGFGHRDRENDLPMTPDTLFAIGSTTKAMTATVLGMMADEGKLDWDEPLVRYLPSFRLADPTVTARITARDLVTHRSGMPRHDLLWYSNNEGTRAEMIARFAHLELTGDLRERYQYNNLMFMTAGHLAGQLADTTWEEVMRTRLFAPLGMTRSNFAVAASQSDDNHALPYRETDSDELVRIPFRSIDLIGPAGSVNSSVNEMAQWLRFNLSGGQVGDEQLILASTLADLHTPHMSIPPAGPDARVSQNAYGMGWVVDVYRGHRRVHHGGGIDGFSTAVSFFPDDDFGIVAFTNRGSGLGGLVSQTAADRVLGLKPVSWIDDALERSRQREPAEEDMEANKDAARVADTTPSRPLDAYAGDYHDPGYGVVTVRHADDRLYARFNGIDTPLAHWHYDVWKGDPSREEDTTFESMTYQFRADFDGQIAELVAPFETTSSPIVFRKQPSASMTDPDYLAGLAGIFSGSTGIDGEVKLSGTTLTLHLPGQPVYTLVPEVSGRFGIEGLQGFNLGFELGDDGTATSVTFYQPNGVFTATRVED